MQIEIFDNGNNLKQLFKKRPDFQKEYCLRKFEKLQQKRVFETIRMTVRPWYSSPPKLLHSKNIPLGPQSLLAFIQATKAKGKALGQIAYEIRESKNSQHTSNSMAHKIYPG